MQPKEEMIQAITMKTEVLLPDISIKIHALDDNKISTIDQEQLNQPDQ